MSTFRVYVGKRYIGKTSNWARAVRLIYENLNGIVETGYAKILRGDDVIMMLDLDVPIKDHPR